MAKAPYNDTVVQLPAGTRTTATYDGDGKRRSPSMRRLLLPPIACRRGGLTSWAGPTWRVDARGVGVVAQTLQSSKLVT